jgi:hypothetical protein
MPWTIPSHGSAFWGHLLGRCPHGDSEVFLFGWILYSRCMSHHFFFFFIHVRHKNGLGEFQVRVGDWGGGGYFLWQAGRNAHELLGWDEPVDTGEGDLGDDDGELGACTRMYTKIYPT